MKFQLVVYSRGGGRYIHVGSFKYVRSIAKDYNLYIDWRAERKEKEQIHGYGFVGYLRVLTDAL